MNKEPHLGSYIRIRGHFHRSVQLAKDWTSKGSLSHYIITPTSRELVGRIVRGILEPGGIRAWSITGPYGTGKSAFALFLLDILGHSDNVHLETGSIRDALDIERSTFLPIPIVGQRAPLVPTLLSCLIDSLTALPSAAHLKQQIQEYLAEDLHDAAAVASFFEATADIVKQEGYDGLIVAIDEFGKLLEYAALHPDSEDLLVMQYLAETAARSRTPLVVITILHTAFAEYARGSDPSRQAEWQKVQGRYTDVAFLEPPEQLLGLVRASLELDLPPALDTSYKKTIEEALDKTAFAEAQQRFRLRTLLPYCLPLEPATALLLWPLFRSKLAQHERSLISFLSSPEPYGIQEFLAITEAKNDEPPAFYRLDRLYDYIVNSLGAAAFVGDRATHWAEIEHALSRVSADAPALSKATIKAIGLLSLYGAAVGLHASLELLQLAIGEPDSVADAVRYLEHASIVVFRKHEGAYNLWEGSDIDLDACYAAGLQHISQLSLATRLRRLVTLTPMVARAHYIETGTLRYYTTDIIDGTQAELTSILNSNNSHPARIIYVLSRNETERKEIMDLGRQLSSIATGEQELAVLAFPHPLLGLESAIEELESWQWVKENVTALQGDPVARQEVLSRTLYARQRLERIAGRALSLRGYSFDPSAMEWIQQGTVHKWQHTQEFVRWLSSLCDRVYCQAPKYFNELLNRDNLSSSATSARRTLLTAMLTSPDKPKLGIIGTPAEYAMYESLLANGGFHKQENSNYAFGEPNAEWKPVWETIAAFLRDTEHERKPVSELYAILKAPPFGLREGPLPVLLCVALLVHRDQIAIYENGLFVPELRIEVLERMTRIPAAFELQFYNLGAEDRATLASLRDVISDVTATAEPLARPDHAALLEVVKPLVLFAARLPTYTRHTKRLDPRTLAVRDKLLQARDPYKLILSDLPMAFGLSPEDPDTMVELPGLLRNSLYALQRAYPALLDEIEDQLRTAFDLHGSLSDARTQLQTRAEPLLNFVADKNLLVLVREASRVDDRDWREVLGRVVQSGNPPAQWRDQDIADFQVRLQQLRSDFVRVEELVAERIISKGSTIFRLGLLNGTVREAREVISMTPETQVQVEDVVRQIHSLLEQANMIDTANRGNRRLKIAALAQVAAKYLLNDDNHSLDTIRETEV